MMNLDLSIIMNRKKIDREREMRIGDRGRVMREIDKGF